MNILENKRGLAEMTLPQLFKYINLLEDRIIYLDLERGKFQAQAQGLGTLRTMFHQQSKRFGKAQTRLAKAQKELYRLKKEEQIFKLPTLPKIKKTKLNKKRREALRRKIVLTSSPISTATFYSSSPSTVDTSPSRQGTPFYYDSPRPSLEFSFVNTTRPISPTVTNVNSPDIIQYCDYFYLPSNSPTVDLDE